MQTRLVLTVAALAVVAMLAGCGGEASKNTPNEAAPPKPETTAMRQRWTLSVSRFSTAIHTIESAIRGSTIPAGRRTTPEAPSASVTVCAIVKALTCHRSGFSFGDSRNNPMTNRMWSKPPGMIWINPSSM